MSALRKAIATAIFDPGLTEGFKGDRTLTEWQTDAVMRVLDQTKPVTIFKPRMVGPTAKLDSASFSFWLELREPGKVPERKGPFGMPRLAPTLREFMDARPTALLTVVTFDDYSRPIFEDGPEALTIADGRSKKLAQRHRRSTAAAFAKATAR